jgi:hypothetical protein
MKSANVKLCDITEEVDEWEDDRLILRGKGREKATKRE